MLPSRDTTVGMVIKGVTSDVTVGDLACGRAAKYPDLYPKLLMACEGDQMNFLVNLWDRVAPTHESKLVWIGLIKNGFFTTLLDPDDHAARDLVRAASYPIELLKQQYDATPRECSRCRRVRR